MQNNSNLKKINADIVIAGTGVAGMYAALSLTEDKNIIMITKSTAEESDSFLAQGGICMLKNDNDYDSYYEDTMRAGHYENNPEAVDIMIRSSQDTIRELIGYGVDFKHNENGSLAFTRRYNRKRNLIKTACTGTKPFQHNNNGKHYNA